MSSLEIAAWGLALTALYVLITGFYAWTSHKTLKAIEKQGASNAEQFAKQIAEATKTADAALLNAQAAIKSERAWVLEQIKFPDKLPVQQASGSVIFCEVAYRVKNYGRTPARITNVRLRFHAVRELQELEEEPTFNTNLKFRELGEYGVVVPPGEEFGLAARFEGPWYDEETIRQVYLGNERICAYGRIEYQNILDNDNKDHFTQFCYLYYVPQGFDMNPEGFKRGGPPKYNQAS